MNKNKMVAAKNTQTVKFVIERLIAPIFIGINTFKKK